MTGGLYNPRPVDDTPVDGQLQHGVTSNWAFDHEADLSAHTYNPMQVMLVGQYMTGLPIGDAETTKALVADVLYAIPFPVPRLF